MASSSTSESHRCDPCAYVRTQTEATWFCQSCDEYLCPECNEVHSRLRATREHMSRSLTDDVSKTTLPDMFTQGMEHVSLDDEDDDEDAPSAPLLQQYSAKLQDDDKQCHITGALVLQNFIMLVDNHNHKVKVFDKTTNSLAFSERVDCAFDLTDINAGTIAVTAGNARYIGLFSVKKTGLTKMRKITSQQKCWGICYHNDLIYVVCQEQAKGVAEINVFTLEGQPMGVFEPESDGEKLLHAPFYITVDHQTSTLFVGNWGGGVVSMTSRGEYLSTCTPRDCTSITGVVLDGQDRLLVCAVSSHNVTRVSSDRKSSEKLVSDERLRPQCLHLNGDTMILCCERSDTVRVYKIA